jgi:hypothetical protein
MMMQACEPYAVRDRIRAMGMCGSARSLPVSP